MNNINQQITEILKDYMPQRQIELAVPRILELLEPKVIIRTGKDFNNLSHEDKKLVMMATRVFLIADKTADKDYESQKILFDGGWSKEDAFNYVEYNIKPTIESCSKENIFDFLEINIKPTTLNHEK